MSQFIGISNALLERYYNKQRCWKTPYKRVLWKVIYLTNYSEETKIATWLGNTYITFTKETFSYQSKQRTCFYDFLRHRITIVALVLHLIWYYSTSWVSNIGDLVLVLIFWSRIMKCGWLSILWIIASNFLKEKKWSLNMLQL